MVNELLNRPNFDVLYCAQRLFSIEAVNSMRMAFVFHFFTVPRLKITITLIPG
jgi:hypothetical protein